MPVGKDVTILDDVLGLLLTLRLLPPADTIPAIDSASAACKVNGRVNSRISVTVKSSVVINFFMFPVSFLFNVFLFFTFPFLPNGTYIIPYGVS